MSTGSISGTGVSLQTELQKPKKNHTARNTAIIAGGVGGTLSATVNYLTQNGITFAIKETAKNKNKNILNLTSYEVSQYVNLRFPNFKASKPIKLLMDKLIENNGKILKSRVGRAFVIGAATTATAATGIYLGCKALFGKKSKSPESNQKLDKRV